MSTWLRLLCWLALLLLGFLGAALLIASRVQTPASWQAAAAAATAAARQSGDLPYRNSAALLVQAQQARLQAMQRDLQHRLREGQATWTRLQQPDAGRWLLQQGEEWLARQGAAVTQLGAQALDRAEPARLAALDRLLRDRRLPLAGGMLACVLLLVVLTARAPLLRALCLPAALLLLGAALAIFAYFQLPQLGWRLDGLRPEQLGPAWMVLAALGVALLCDLLLNRARLTRRLLRTLASPFGGPGLPPG